MSIKLSDSQLVVLSAAAQREDHCLVAPPKIKGGAAQKFAAKLLAAGFAKEIKAKPGMPAWRRDEDAGQSYVLKLTAAGLKAIAVDGEESKAPAESPGPVGDTVNAPMMSESTPPPTADSLVARRAESSSTARPTTSTPRGGAKLTQVMGLLRRDQGATLAELVAATGWLPHTTRAAMTGLRKRGYAVTLDRSNKERGSTYNIEASEDLAAEDRGLAGNERARPTTEPLATERLATLAAGPTTADRSAKREPAARSRKRKAA
jgi:Protein of unknown function (DUF3489)